jgi:CheY-like chemotaxis protein
MHSEEAEDGRRALELIERAAKSGQPIDVVLLDRTMPELDGFELLEQLAKREDLRQAAGAVALADGRPRRGQPRPGLGADARLVKPIRRQDLLDALCGLFGAGSPRQQPAQGKQIERLDGCKVLAVEDNRVNQQVLRGILERAGAEVTLADNGADALQRLDEDGFDLILMDCEMPVLDGYAATRKLRAQETEAGRLHERQVIIALTAHTALAEREKCTAAGMDDYLSKPVRAARLIQTVKRWWQNPERVRASILARANLDEPAGACPDSPAASAAPQPMPKAPEPEPSVDQTAAALDGPSSEPADEPQAAPRPEPAPQPDLPAASPPEPAETAAAGSAPSMPAAPHAEPAAGKTIKRTRSRSPRRRVAPCTRSSTSVASTASARPSATSARCWSSPSTRSPAAWSASARPWMPNSRWPPARPPTPWPASSPTWAPPTPSPMHAPSSAACVTTAAADTDPTWPPSPRPPTMPSRPSTCSASRSATGSPATETDPDAPGVRRQAPAEGPGGR